MNSGSSNGGVSRRPLWLRVFSAQKTPMSFSVVIFNMGFSNNLLRLLLNHSFHFWFVDLPCLVTTHTSSPIGPPEAQHSPGKHLRVPEHTPGPGVCPYSQLPLVSTPLALSPTPSVIFFPYCPLGISLE